MERIKAPEMRIAASEWRSDVAYLAREFEIEAERKRAEKKRSSVKAKEDAVGTKKHFMARLFEKRHTSR
jgi:hypothetical protein